jgi:hypothetical protein
MQVCLLYFFLSKTVSSPSTLWGNSNKVAVRGRKQNKPSGTLKLPEAWSSTCQPAQLWKINLCWLQVTLSKDFVTYHQGSDPPYMPPFLSPFSAIILGWWFYPSSLCKYLSTAFWVPTLLFSLSPSLPLLPLCLSLPLLSLSLSLSLSLPLRH